MTTHKKPTKAFILGAGMGTRLRPMTDNTPKPMVNVAGKAIIEYVLDDLIRADITDVVVNTHYLAPLMETHLSKYKTPQIHFSREDELLNTGGGIKKALSHFGGEPFYVLSGDSFWENGETPALERMAEAWNPDIMDILIMLQPVSRMVLTGGVGDYDLDDNGRAIRSHSQKGEYMWTSIRICKPEIFDGSPEGAFSFLDLLDKAEGKGRLHAIIHDAEWHHISTPTDLEITDHYLRTNLQAKTSGTRMETA